MDHAKGGTNLGTYAYAYDAEDRLTSATVPTAAGSNTTDYACDDTDQLTDADHTAQTDESYAYDANGNRTSGGSVVDAGNRIAEDATHTYLYDDNGNLLRETQKSNGAYRVYWWDHRDRLVKVVFRTVAGVCRRQDAAALASEFALRFIAASPALPPAPSRSNFPSESLPGRV